MKKREMKKVYRACEEFRWAIKPLIKELESKKGTLSADDKKMLRALKKKEDDLWVISEQMKPATFPKGAMTYSELERKFIEINKKNLPHKVGYIVYKAKNFKKKEWQTLEERTYSFSSDNKVFQP